MKITIFGTRGSYPVCIPDILEYGGNTTCIFVEEKDEHIIIDGGSGIVNLGRHIINNQDKYPKNLRIVVTHTHWDHVLGFPFFSPFYKVDYSINIYGADSETMNVKDVFSKQHHPHNFPIPFESLKAKISFNTLDGDDTILLNHLKIKTYQLNHPGKDLGYRFESESGTFVFLTDLAPIENNYLGIGWNEQAKADPKSFEKKYYEGLVKFIDGANLIMHDTNFTEEEIKNKRHWGHSTPDDAIKLAFRINIPPTVILSHHDPFHTDKDMDNIYQYSKDLGKKMGVDILVAKEGGEFTL